MPEPIFSAAGQSVATGPSAAQVFLSCDLFLRSVSLQHLSPAAQTLPAEAAPPRTVVVLPHKTDLLLSWVPQMGDRAT